MGHALAAASHPALAALASEAARRADSKYQW